MNNKKQNLINYFTSVFKTEKKEINSLNGIRAILIFLLFFGHMYGVSENYGTLEVVNEFIQTFATNVSFILDVFFVLSGYLISGPLLKELSKTGRLNLKQFYIRRTLRIFPPYYIFLFLQALFILAALRIVQDPLQIEQLNKGLYSIIYDVFYLSNYYNGIMLHGWSLSLEEQFYLFFPALLLIVYRYIPDNNKLKALIILYFLPLIYRFVVFFILIEPAAENMHYSLYLKYIYRPFQGHADSLFAGIITAYIVEYRKSWISSLMNNAPLRKILHSGLWILLLIFLTLFSEKTGSIISQVIRFNVINISIAFLMLFSMREGGISNRFFSMKIFSPFAKLSYIAYILHMLLLGYLMVPLAKKEVIYFKDLLIYWIPISLIIFAVSYIFHLITERPFMILKNHWTKNYKKESMPRL